MLVIIITWIMYEVDMVGGWRVDTSDAVCRKWCQHLSKWSCVCKATREERHCSQVWLIDTTHTHTHIYYCTTSRQWQLMRFCFWSSVFDVCLQLCCDFSVCNCVALQENCYNCRRETLIIAVQWHWDHTIKFARWQHPAVGHGARFPVLGSINCCYC